MCLRDRQKGNAPTERKIQRMFRRPEVSRLIKKCNDFGAGGVSVAIGELAAGLKIDLDKVPKKYAGLDLSLIHISRVPAIRRDLHRLAEFAFAFRGDEGFPEEWVQRAEELVRLRVRAILE